MAYRWTKLAPSNFSSDRDSLVVMTRDKWPVHYSKKDQSRSEAIDINMTYPSTTLLHVDDETVWLQSPLQDLVHQHGSPALSMKMPACEEVFCDSIVREATDIDPCLATQDEARAWTPRRSAAVSCTIFSMSAGDV